MAREKRTTPARQSARSASRLLQKHLQNEVNDNDGNDHGPSEEHDGNNDGSDYDPYEGSTSRRQTSQGRNQELKDLTSTTQGTPSGGRDDDVIVTGTSRATKTIMVKSSMNKHMKWKRRHTSVTGKHSGRKAPIDHFMKQYGLLQTTVRASKRLKIELKGGTYDAETEDPDDAYSFLTYATRRFIVALSHIIQESHKEFNLARWNVKKLGPLGKGHSTSRSESACTAVYLESLFGKMPAGTSSSLFQVPEAQPERTPALSTVHSSPVVDKNVDLMQFSDQQPTVKLVSNKQHPGATPSKNCQRQIVYTKIQKLNRVEPAQVDIGDINTNIDDGIGEFDDDGDDDDITWTNNENDQHTGDIRSLICVLCFKRKFPDIKAFAKHYQEVHHQSDTLEFWLGLQLSSAAVTVRQRKEQCGQKSGIPYIRCGLCTFQMQKDHGETLTELDQNEMIQQYVNHYIDIHHPKHRCEHCKKWFNIETIFQLHKEHCGQTLAVFGFEPPTEKADVYYYMKKRCGLHKIDFTNEFIYADHMCKFHIHEVDGGEMAQILGLSVKQLLAERNSVLGICYVCHMCGKDNGTFDSPGEWIDHVHDKHSGRVICEVCCQFVGSIKQHTKNAHGTFGESYFICLKDYCKYRGAGFPSIFQHVRTFHPEIDLEVPIEFWRQCSDCDFRMSYNYNKKLIDHAKPTRKMFTHYGTAHDKKFCEKCGNFYGRKYYETHLETHDAEETGIKKYTCTICNQKFLHRDTLKDHERRHDEKNRTHMCHLCSKSFFFRGDLNTHIKMVHQEKSLFCAKCNKSFALPNHLRQHVKKCCNPDYQYNQSLASKRKCASVEHEQAPALKMDTTLRTQIEANIETLNRDADIKVPLSDDLKFSILTPVTDIATTSQLIAHAHSAAMSTTSGHPRVLEQHEPQNMSMSGQHITNYYETVTEQQALTLPQGLAYDEVYRATHSLGMILPGFNISAQMAYAPQTHPNQQHNLQ